MLGSGLADARCIVSQLLLINASDSLQRGKREDAAIEFQKRLDIELIDNIIFSVKDCWILVTIVFRAVDIKLNAVFDFFLELLKVA